MMSSLSLVLDGILTEAPPLALPPSATAAGSAATAAAAAVSLGSSAMASGMHTMFVWISVTRYCANWSEMTSHALLLVAAQLQLWLLRCCTSSEQCILSYVADVLLQG
jgi:hypothetical protein